MRNFYRCSDCTHVFAIEGPEIEPACDCGSMANHMGAVSADRLVRHESRCPCDHRCTGALGPICNCQCGGANHGMNRVAAVTVAVGGVPVVSGERLQDRLKIKAEFLAAAEEARARLMARHGATLADMAAGIWISDRAKWDGARVAREKFNLSRQVVAHNARMKSLAKVCP